MPVFMPGRDTSAGVLNHLCHRRKGVTPSLVEFMKTVHESVFKNVVDEMMCRRIQATRGSVLHPFVRHLVTRDLFFSSCSSCEISVFFFTE